MKHSGSWFWLFTHVGAIKILRWRCTKCIKHSAFHISEEEKYDRSNICQWFYCHIACLCVFAKLYLFSTNDPPLKSYFPTLLKTKLIICHSNKVWTELIFFCDLCFLFVFIFVKRSVQRYLVSFSFRYLFSFFVKRSANACSGISVFFFLFDICFLFSFCEKKWKYVLREICLQIKKYKIPK